MPAGPHIIVVGAGHAGIAAAQGCSRIAGARVTLVEPRMTHLLKTQLHETIVHPTMPIELPIKSLLPSKVKHIRAAVTHVDAPRALVEAGRARIEGDFVIIASGARTRSPFAGGSKARPARRVGRAQTSGTTKHRAGAPAIFVLDDEADVRSLRVHVEKCVDRAAAERVSAAARRAFLSVLVVGGGYTGVEASAELAFLMRRRALAKGISPALVHVTVCEQRPRLFAGVPDDELAQRMQDALARKAIDVRTGEEVRFDRGSPIVGRKAFETATVLLATGIEGVVTPRKPFLSRAARWAVDETLCVPKTDGILAIGDAAVVPTPNDGPPIAPNAQHAVQEGRHAAAVITALVRGKKPAPFHAATLGEFLTLGDGEVIGWVQFAGRRVHLSGVSAQVARAAAMARYLAQVKLGARG